MCITEFVFNLGTQSTLNFIQDDLPLRTEVLFCLQQLNLSVFDIPLVDEVDFNGLRILKEMKIEIVLVDHNNIFDESLESECLIEIIDHHQLGKIFSEEKVRLTVQAVGSCSTLVMDRIWKEHPGFKDEMEFTKPTMPKTCFQ